MTASIKDLSQKEANAYFEGAAMAITAYSSFNYVINNIVTDDEALAGYLFQQSVSPMFSMTNINSENELGMLYIQGAEDASEQLAYQQPSICLKPERYIEAKEVQQAAEDKFSGAFGKKYLSIILVGVIERFTEILPCKS